MFPKKDSLEIGWIFWHSFVKMISNSFFSEVKEELKKVIWPTKKETLRLTTIVLTSSLIVGIIIGGFDYLFIKVFALILKV